MVGENDRGRTDPCAKHIDGRTDPVRTDGCELVEGANGPFTDWFVPSHGSDVGMLPPESVLLRNALLSLSLS